MEVIHNIGGIDVNPPINNQELNIELNFDKGDSYNQAVSITEFEWGIGDVTDGADAVEIIKFHRDNGLSTGVGVFEGLPHKITLIYNNKSSLLFDGYIDTSKALFDCDKIVTNSVEKGQIDWLNDTADKITFAGMYQAKVFNSSDFISIPYVLNSVPDNKEAFMAVISLAFLTDSIATQLEEIIELCIALVNVLEWTTVIRLLLRMIYVAGLIVLLVATLNRIINLIIQPVKFHDGMRVKRLCEIGASHFGFTFESSILNSNQYKDAVIIPEKYNHQVNVVTNATTNVVMGNDDILGFLTPNNTDARGYYNGTFGQLLRDLKEVFNGKIIIDGTILRLEREDFNNSAPDLILPPVDQTSFTVNHEDLKANYTVEFLTDINDKQTLQNYVGTITQATTSPTKSTNTDMILMTGLERRVIPFARGNRKLTFTSPENIIKSIAPIFDPIASTLASIINAMLTVIELILDDLSGIIISSMIGVPAYVLVSAILSLSSGGLTFLTFQTMIDWFEDLTGYDTGLDLTNIPRLNYTPIGDSMDDREGMLLMENDMIDVPKLCIIEENKENPKKTNIHIDNKLFINSKFLYDNFHFVRSFDYKLSSDRPNGNQYRKFETFDNPFSCDDYELLKNSNHLQTEDGEDGEILSTLWNVDKLTATHKFRINKKYTINIETKTITPNGK